MNQGTKKAGGQRSPKITYSELPPSKEELIQTGIEAGKLLGSPVYGLAHQSVMQDLQDEWMRTEGHERERRESLYLEMKVFSRATHKLAEFVQMANALSDEDLGREERNQSYQ